VPASSHVTREPWSGANRGRASKLYRRFSGYYGPANEREMVAGKEPEGSERSGNPRPFVPSPLYTTLVTSARLPELRLSSLPSPPSGVGAQP
jgi:hypothetical protein